MIKLKRYKGTYCPCGQFCHNAEIKWVIVSVMMTLISFLVTGGDVVILISFLVTGGDANNDFDLLIMILISISHFRRRCRTTRQLHREDQLLCH